MKRVWALLLVVLTGCSGPDTAWMPLKVGKTWTYSVQAASVTTITEFKTARSIAVGSTRGVEIQSKMGNSRFAWEGDKLVSSALGQAEVSPPIPFLVLGQKKASWKGFVKSLGIAEEATATLEMAEPTSTLLDGQTRTVLQTKLEVVFPGRTGRGARKVRVDTWFQRGVGIVKQVQRTSSLGDVQDVALSLVGR